MLINGSAGTSPFLANRGLAYGDGVFETIRIHRQKLLFGDLHLTRLAKGLQGLAIPDCVDALYQDLDTVRTDLPAEGVLKIIVTRGAGGRGYRAGDAPPERFLSLHPLPPAVEKPGIQAFVCRTGLSHNPMLAGIKHLNRLEQVIASVAWPGEAFHEGLMLDTDGFVIEGTRSNVFACIDGRLLTPSLEYCGIAGILRQYLLEEMPALEVAKLTLSDLAQADEIFFGNSVAGIWPVLSMHLPDGQVFSRPPGPGTREAEALFQRALDAL